MAAVVTEYRHNSHADVILSRLLLTDMLDGTGRDSPLKLVSLYTDQKPANDISRLLAASHRFPIKTRIADALTLGTGRLAVDGVLLVAEHGNYPFSATGNHQYPKRRFWDETIEVFRRSGKVVPVFIDKHLSDNWKDARQIYDTARELKIPLMAGSSVPGTWRHPARGRRARGEADGDRGHHLWIDRRLRLPRAGGRAVARRAAARRGDRGPRRAVPLGRCGLAGPRRADHRPGAVPSRPGACPRLRERPRPRSEGGARSPSCSSSITTTACGSASSS